MTLYELTEDEWRDIYRAFLPKATDDDFKRDWEAFQKMKADREKRMATQ